MKNLVFNSDKHDLFFAENTLYFNNGVISFEAEIDNWEAAQVLGYVIKDDENFDQMYVIDPETLEMVPEEYWEPIGDELIELAELWFCKMHGQRFRNFMVAELRAEEMAEKQIKEGMSLFIEVRKNNVNFTKEERLWMEDMVRGAVRDLKRLIMEQFIMVGLIPDCIMARRFMAHVNHPEWPRLRCEPKIMVS